MRVQKDLTELTDAGVISPEVANRIQRYYQQKESSPSNRLLTIFGVLGAALVGLGVILIIAHNWDELTRGLKTILAFLPLLLGQGLCAFTLLKNPKSTVWRESTATFLFFAVGACIALVSQIYHLPGNLGSFLFGWVLLCLPIVYVLRSSMVSLLYLVGITYYACVVSYFSRLSVPDYWYWLLLLGVVPYYYQLYRRQAARNFLTFHHWLVPLSVVIALGTVTEEQWELTLMAYFSLFSVYYLLGKSDGLAKRPGRQNGYRVLGSLGTVFLLFFVSFDDFWQDLRNGSFWTDLEVVAPEFLAAAVLTLLAAGLLYRQYRKAAIQPLASAFLVFLIVFVLGLFSPLGAILINLYVLLIGILMILSGTRQDHLGILNAGLLIVTGLVACRFFDTDLSFVLRGLLFVLVGCGFFGANYWTLQKRKLDEA